MVHFGAHSLVWSIVIAAFLIIILGSFFIEAKIALDVINVKLRVKIKIFGLTLISLLIYYDNCAVYIKTPKGKPKALSLKPVTKFETKFSFNIAKIIKDKNIYISTLVGIDCNAFATSLIAGSLVVFGNLFADRLNVAKKSKLKLNINASSVENKGKIFLRFRFHTSIAKIFVALLESI